MPPTMDFVFVKTDYFLCLKIRRMAEKYQFLLYAKCAGSTRCESMARHTFSREKFGSSVQETACTIRIYEGKGKLSMLRKENVS